MAPGSDDRLDLLGGRSEPNELVDAVSEGVGAYAGRRCIYRLGFIGMELPGLPDRIDIGRVKVRFGHGPLTTQRTSIVQRPGDQLVFDKTLHPFVAVGEGIPISVMQIEETFPDDPSDAVDRWYAEAAGAAGLLSALLDERLFQRPLLEDVVLFDAAGERVTGAADVRMRLRHYLPYPISDVERQALDELGGRYTPETPTSAAARWYLRAGQTGPVADSIVYLWIAIDALLGTEGDRVVHVLRDRFEGLGIDLSPLPLSIGRLYGLRGDVVHKGLEQPPHLREGYYMLEALTRALLRAELDLESLWPFQVGQPWSPFKDLEALEGSWQNPQVELRRGANAGPAARKASIRDRVSSLLPGIRWP
jgi:hypothetical protein